MENVPNFEGRESIVDRLIEELAQKEGMDPQDIFADIITFIELSQEDEDARFYFEELAEKIGVSFDEMMEYAITKAKETVSILQNSGLDQ